METPFHTLVPHAGTMCLLDAIQSWDENRIACRASSHQDPSNPLRQGDQLPVLAGIEYAAQAVAAHGSLLARDSQAGTPPRAGMIAVLGGVQWHAPRLDTSTAPLLVEAVRLAALPQGLQYRFNLDCNGSRLLHGELIIALQEPAA